jgi:hypothetical protein
MPLTNVMSSSLNYLGSNRAKDYYNNAGIAGGS